MNLPQTKNQNANLSYLLSFLFCWRIQWLINLDLNGVDNARAVEVIDLDFQTKHIISPNYYCF